MHCNVCDRELSQEEIKYDPRLRGKFEMCNSCLEAVKSAFKSDEDEETEAEVEMEESVSIETFYSILSNSS